MDFEESLNQVAAKVRDLKDGIETEEATKTAFIMPFIGQVLGYDVFNPNEVVPEFTADVGVKKGEKVDYALVRDDQVQILIECKKVGAPLSLENASQLYRYFAVTNARIGVLTNGQVWNFYMDIDEPNRMDSKPFLVLDLLDIDPTVVPAVEKLTKPAFDLDSIASSAEELKYVGALKRAVGDEFREPSDDFVKLLASHVYEGAFYASVMDKFRPLVSKALKQYLSDQVNDRLKTALGADDIKIGTDDDMEDDQTQEGETPADDDGVVTTEEEIAAYRIIKAIACSDVDPERITMRDAKSYCSIFLDDNNRKPVARLFFNTKQKYIGLFDENKNVTRHPLESLNGIYAFADQIREEVQRLLQ
ncbi:MAG: type I restriction enzyme HsdR N-terminal domain-containing protein [Bifidobacterium pseudolongum]|uniref:type I restriction endonuclease n=1 Tax=Bifidobacterium pseudolongum TaxID=1694 RepID=UPI00101EC394|nr:type I restriction endonuclease [Bifidobacterium pseudolongum]MCI6772676.1 type I restriction enzyme HsdR N-terminal domain-containing protein [Bifidobacterium pseudolongum]RYQ74579.1 restriction endonuclease or methylase [Bifidobacterium pseudolongum subsp. globosum]